jgi:hypothetical protein
MGEQLRMRAPAHYLRVDLSDPAEVEYWMVVLYVSRVELERAVACAGRDLWEVRAWLVAQSPGPRHTRADTGVPAR